MREVQHVGLLVRQHRSPYADTLHDTLLAHAVHGQKMRASENVSDDVLAHVPRVVPHQHRREKSRGSHSFVQVVPRGSRDHLVLFAGRVASSQTLVHAVHGDVHAVSLTPVFQKRRLRAALRAIRVVHVHGDDAEPPERRTRIVRDGFQDEREDHGVHAPGQRDANRGHDRWTVVFFDFFFFFFRTRTDRRGGAERLLILILLILFARPPALGDARVHRTEQRPLQEPFHGSIQRRVPHRPRRLRAHRELAPLQNIVAVDVRRALQVLQTPQRRFAELLHQRVLRGVLREARVESLHRAAKPHDGFLRVSVGHEQKHLLRCCDSLVPPRPHARVDDAHSLLVASSHLLVSLGVVPVDVPGELVQDHD
mmetsp:Transcript_5087/g.20446  ORF Transcript_5087/g.20446 Transcript_5087/m.20446 type:complete len:367 (-) Transcript_5087:259-1359(-)